MNKELLQSLEGKEVSINGEIIDSSTVESVGANGKLKRSATMVDANDAHNHDGTLDLGEKDHGLLAEFIHGVCGGGLSQYSHGLDAAPDSMLTGAHELFPPGTYGWCNFLAEICSLLNCYAVSYYLFHGIVNIEHPFTHFFIIVPAMLNMFYTSPRMAMNFTMLCSVLYKDNEAVAETLEGMEEIRETRNKLRERLLLRAVKTFSRDGFNDEEWREHVRRVPPKHRSGSPSRRAPAARCVALFAVTSLACSRRWTQRRSWRTWRANFSRRLTRTTAAR